MMKFLYPGEKKKADSDCFKKYKTEINYLTCENNVQPAHH